MFFFSSSPPLCILFSSPIVRLLSRSFFFFSLSSSCSFHGKFTLTHAIIISSQLKSGNPDPPTLPRCAAANDGAGCRYLSRTEARRFARRGSAFPRPVLPLRFSNCGVSATPRSEGGRRTESGMGGTPTPRCTAEQPNPASFLCTVRQSSFPLIFIFNPCPDLFHITEKLSRKHCGNVFFFSFFLTSCLGAKHFGSRAKTSDRFAACKKNEGGFSIHTPLGGERIFECN